VSSLSALRKASRVMTLVDLVREDNFISLSLPIRILTFRYYSSL
jgi:hypothetical protein